MENILEVNKLTKTFQSGQKSLTVLDAVTFEIKKGESVSIVGPSGSGKTTLLGLCAGLDLPSEGYIELSGQRLNEMDEDERAFVRNRKTGFIFQNFQLLPTLTALENVCVPVELRGERGAETKGEELLKRVGLGDRMNHYPSQLSGGEQQRVALARAFISSPDILFADEPTGNLDEETAENITRLLFEINREKGTTLILVTHNLELAGNTQRVLKLKGGKLISDERKQTLS